MKPENINGYIKLHNTSSENAIKPTYALFVVLESILDVNKVILTLEEEIEKYYKTIKESKPEQSSDEQPKPWEQSPVTYEKGSVKGFFYLIDTDFKSRPDQEDFAFAGIGNISRKVTEISKEYNLWQIPFLPAERKTKNCLKQLVHLLSSKHYGGDFTLDRIKFCGSITAMREVLGYWDRMLYSPVNAGEQYDSTKKAL